MNSLTPNLMVNDVEKTIEYYTDKLGFTLLQVVPEGGNKELDWAMLKNQEVVIMFQSIRSLSKELPEFQKRRPGGGFTMYIKTDDIDKLHDELKFNEVEIISEIESTFYDTIEFSIIDLNGYVITFSQYKK